MEQNWIEDFSLETMPVRFGKFTTERRDWCLENIGEQDVDWCIVITVYGGDRQFRFKNEEDWTLYTLTWE